MAEIDAHRSGRRRGMSRLRLGTFANPEHREYFDNFKSIRLPSIGLAVALSIVPAIVMLVLFLRFTPWVQTSVGSGSVTALDPADRSQAITALAGGRISRWFVRDGSVVEAGDPILEIIDLDPQFISRLEQERAATENRYQASRLAAQTARIDYDRKKRLFDQGLVARVDFEVAEIKYREASAKAESDRASLAGLDINLSRQSLRTVLAPRAGTIVTIEAGDTATLVSPGQTIASFVPSGVRLAAEIYISGLDASIVEPGRLVRLRFEGWPSVQFGGWPEVAIGTFGGIVASVDPVASANGRFRVLVTEDPSDPWPEERYLRLGARAQGWILLSEVKLGYELWRRLNSFPPRPPQARRAPASIAAVTE